MGRSLHESGCAAILARPQSQDSWGVADLLERPEPGCRPRARGLPRSFYNAASERRPMRSSPLVFLALGGLLAACSSKPVQSHCAQPPCTETDGPPGTSDDGPPGTSDDGPSGTVDGGGADGAAPGTPTVVSVSPPDGSTIGLARAITVTFSEAMNAGSQS